MSLFAFALVLLSALCHATWNLLAKGVPSGAPFIWLFGVASLVVYAPFALWLIATQPTQLGWLQLLAIVGSSLLHLGYFLSLQRGYRVGDLSLVYPLARGTGPLLSVVAAIILLGERPTGWALAGGLLIVLSIFIFTGGASLFRKNTGTGQALRFGLLTGLFIASYTLLDKFGVTTLATAPLLYNWLGNAGLVALLTPLASRRRLEVKAMWRTHKRAVLGVAILSPLAYILVLSALVFTPVSYVAPAREMSILIAAILGASVLKEGAVKRRLVAASLMAVGVVILALG